MLRERNWGKLRWLGVPLAAALLTGCGDSAEQTDTSGGVTGVTLSGSVFASYVDGASCNVQDINGNVIAGPFTTSASGGYSIVLPDSHLAENLVVECNGGTFTDEATGLPQTAGAMSAYIAGGTASVGTSVHVTPSTTIISALVEGGMSAEAAVNAFTAAFGFTPDYAVAPTDATNPEAGADNARLLAGLRAATFSQLAQDLGGIAQADLIAALVADLADDGVLNGNTTLPADIQNRFTQALVNFRAGGNDATGLDNSKLGGLPFAKTAVTGSYKVTYVEGTHSAVDGKTSFKVQVEDKDSRTKVEGGVVTIKPLMFMDKNDAGMVRKHSTPFIPDCNEMDAGEYHCTVYYVMPSIRSMGGMVMSMGYWTLDVTVGEGEAAPKATFYPEVTATMPGHAQVRLNAIGGDAGVGDTVPMGPSGTKPRGYYLFKHGLTAAMGGGYDLDLFIAVNETMMSFPALDTGVPLNTATGQEAHAMTPDSIEVAVSLTGVDGWVIMDEDAANPGRWSTAGGALALVDDAQATIYVRLTVNGVNGEQKTTDGALPNDVPVGSEDPVNNHFAVFTLTPGGMMPMDGMDMAM